MFLFRCCMRVDCGCQSESETEVSRSSHSTCDHSQQSEKQIQCRLLPQPVDKSYAKHYSGCSHVTPSRSLLAGSTQSVDYEEVLCVSVPPRWESSEPNYARINDTVIRKPPCSIGGVVNNNFSPEISSCNNNVLKPESSDDVKLVQDLGAQDGSGSNGSSSESSASSSVDEHNSAEVKYVADIRQFRSSPTSILRPHGEDCCCPVCQSVTDNVSRTEAELIHHSNDLKCLCKSCRDFCSRMQHANRNGGIATTAAVDAFNNRYRVISGIAQDTDNILLTWSQSLSVCKIAERAKFDSENVESTHESSSLPESCSDTVFGALKSEDVDDDTGLLSSDDELHYVFHKFIHNSCLEEPFTDNTTDNRLRPNATRNEVVWSDSGTKQECTSARSADDLEVAFFMVGDISPGSPASVFADASLYIEAAIPAPVAVTTRPQTSASEATITSAAEPAAHSYSFDIELSAYCIRKSLSAVDDNAKEKETDTFTVCEASALTDSGELESASGALGSEVAELEAGVHVDSNLNVVDNEDQQTYSQSDGGEMQRDVIVRKLSDSSSLIIELPAVSSEHVSAVCVDAEDMSFPTSAFTGDTCTAEELAPAADSVVIEQSLEIVTPECITEHPVSADEVKLPQAADDISYEQHTAAEVELYVRDIVAEAARQIADDTASTSVGICRVASEDEKISSDVSQVENYVISFDVHILQQPTDGDGEGGADQILVWSSHAASPDKSICSGDVKLHDLVKPVEYVSSDIAGDVVAASGVNLDSEDDPTGTRDDGLAATVSTGSVEDDFFMQHVLPDDSILHSLELESTAESEVHTEHVTDQLEIDHDEDLLDAKTLEIRAENIVDIVVTDAVAELQLEVAATPAVSGVQYDEDVDVDHDVESLVEAKEFETAAQTVVDDASGKFMTGQTSSPTAAGDDTRPTRSSCLLHSPTEPHRKKSVHFADMHGLQLEVVQHYDQMPEPEEPLASLEDFLSKLSAAAAERRAKWTEHHPSLASSWLCNSAVYLLACFELPGSQEELLERVQHSRVALESCSFDDMALAISGVVRVANVAFRKKISVRYTVNRWITQTDVDGEYIHRSNDGTTDRFSFTVILPSQRQFVVGSEVEFAIRYVAGDDPSFEFWDNNHRRNYIVRCCSKGATRDVRGGNVSGTDDCRTDNDE